MDNELQKMLENFYEDLMKSCEAYENGEDDSYYEENKIQSLYDYVTDSYDIEYTKRLNGDFVCCSVCIALGGPNIYIDTNHNRLEGYWGSQVEYLYFDDYRIAEIIEDIVQEIVDCY